MSRTSIARSLSIVLCLSLGGAALAAAKTEDDFLSRYAETLGFRHGRPAAIRVTPDARAVLFLRSGPRSFERELYELDLAGGAERVLATAAALLGGQEERLTPEELARRERQRVAARGIAAYELSPDGARVLVPLGGRLFLIERASGAVREIGRGASAPIDPRFSPDGTMVACVRDDELHVIDVASGTERQLTRGAGRGVTHGLAEFVAQEEMSRHEGYWWSPDSSRLLYQRSDTSEVERFHIADARHPEKPPQSWPYPRAGQANAVVRVGLVPAAGGETTWVEWDRERYEYLAAVSWTERAPLTLLVQDRRQTEERLLAVDPERGSTTTLLVERDEAWLNLFDGMPRWLPDGSGFLWISERDGAPRLELRDRDGAMLRPLHGVELGLQGFEALLPGAALVRASADPTQSQVLRLDLGEPAAAPVPLTSGVGVHAVASTGEAAALVIHAAAPEGDESWSVVDPDGRHLAAIAPATEDPGLRPRLEFVEVDEGSRCRAVLVRPRDFAPGRRYPVLVHVYGGPGSQTVRREARRYLLDQWYADQGYVLVSIDGRGTPGRGRDWERATKGDLIGPPMEDQVAALRALGRSYPELDLGRVGIHGWSFGGYFAAMAVLRHPELFRVAVAGAPVTSWENYDTHYTERYMGLPADNPAGYAATSAVRAAGGLQRPLLLVHGTADDNVYFLHSLELAEALLRAGRPFEFLPLPGLTHMVSDPQVVGRLQRRILERFDRELKAATPAGGSARLAPGR